MIIDFKVKNFRSIKDEAVFSLLASKDSMLENNIIWDGSLKNDALLKSAVIYGANASGKTNVINGLNTMVRIILGSHNVQKGTNIPYEPFKLDKYNVEAPTEFNITFIKNDIKYVYGFSHDSKKVIQEYLYHYPKGRRKLVFERKKTYRYRFTEDEKEQSFIAERTPENVLYFSRATQLNFQPTSEPFEWFRKDLRVIGPADHPMFRNFTSRLISSGDMKSKILKALKAADLGIDEIIPKKIEFKYEGLPEEIDEETKRALMNIEDFDITSVHNGVAFDFLNEESEGTLRMYSLIGPMIDALENDRVLVLDEMDTKLHYLLNLFILEQFHDRNNERSQLIFTTHNTNMLDQKIFRRDQIWFTEKDPKTGATDLYSLLEFHPRNDANLQKGYLAGRYGALPFIKTKVYSNDRIR